MASLLQSLPPLRQAVPGILVVFGVLIMALPFGALWGLQIAPAVAIIAIYYFTLYHPDRLPAWTVFAAGLLYDMLSAGALGLWALVFLLTYAGTVWQRQLFIGKAAYSPWAGFMLAAGAAAVFAWLLTAFQEGGFGSPFPIAWQMAWTALTYPVFARLFDMLD